MEILIVRHPRKEAILKLSGNHNFGTAALYCRLSRDDNMDAESNSIQNQEIICKGWFLPSNTYDCGSFVVNGTAVVGKETKNL